MKLLVLPFGDAACASTHYRVLQYLDMLKKDGIDCEVLAPGTMPSSAVIAESDTVLVQKKLFPAHQVRTLRKHAKRLLLTSMTPPGIPMAGNTAGGHAGAPTAACGALCEQQTCLSSQTNTSQSISMHWEEKRRFCPWP